MFRLPKSVKYPFTESYGEIIDVRSESEFACDRLPGAINLPVLTNEERVKVGTIYKQVSSFEARKLGASFVAKNISCHLANHFANKEKSYYPLIYCWRGGQRSHSLALVLLQIGWQVAVLEGGYKAYRQYVNQQLTILPSQFTYQVLCGLTGSGKTYFLQQLASQGHQVLDLEQLANHRGSLLGQQWKGYLEAQPSQKQFDSLILQKFQHFDVRQPIWVESESNKIGQLHLPLALWQRMKQARCVEIQLPLETRVAWLLSEYSYLIENPEILKEMLARLKYRYGRDKLKQWYGLIETQQWWKVVSDLLETHYDPTYRRSQKQIYHQIVQVIAIADLSNENVERVIESLS